MYYILLSPYSLFLVLTLIALLIAGVCTGVQLFCSIFPYFVTSVSDQVMESLLHTVQLAAIIFCIVVILLQLIGGGINAL